MVKGATAKRINFFMLAVLLVGQTILGPLATVGVAYAEDNEAEENQEASSQSTGDDAVETGEEVDKTELEKLLNNKKQADEYTEDTFAAYAASITKGEKVFKDTAANQIEVDEAIADIKDTQNALKEKTSTDEDPAESEEDKTEGDTDSTEKDEESDKEDESKSGEEEGTEEESQTSSKTFDSSLNQTTKAQKTYDDMNLTDPGVNLNTEFKVNGNDVTSPANVKNGDKANFKFTLADITGHHNYGPGTKLEVVIPSIFNNVSGSGTIGTIGTYSVSGNIVTVVFNEEIRSWDADGNDIGSLPIENVNFFVQAEFNYTGTNLNTSVAIPGGETITLNFTPKNGKVIEKNRVGNFTQHNADSIEWKVVVNTDLSSANDFVDTLQGGHKFDPNEGITVKEINLGPDGGPDDYTPGQTVTPTVNYEENNTKVTVTGLESNKAYEITYKTYPDDPKNATNVTYSNLATYGQGNSDNDSARITYDPPLEKTAGDANTNDLTTEWTIKVNHNERNLENITVTDTWSTTGGSGDQEQEIVGSIQILDSNNDDVTGNFTVNHDATNKEQGFNVVFGDIDEAYTIKYKTKPTDDTYITSNMTVSNNVTRSDDENTFKSNASVTYNKTSFMLNKTAEGVNYADKTMKWKIVANQAGKTLASGTVFEDRFTPNNNQLLDEDTLSVKDSSGNDISYEVTDSTKEGFNLELKEQVTGQITIEYDTDYDIRDVGSNDRSYRNDVTITNHQIPNMGELTDWDTQSVKGEQAANGKKIGHYDYAAKKFVWEVEVNFNYNTFTNAIFEDEIDNDPAQEIENIKVVKGTLNSSGDFVEGNEVTIDNDANAPNKIKLALGDISTPYKITYESKVIGDVIPETPGKLEVNNTATLTEEGETDPNASWSKKVGVNYTDQLIKKDMDQVGNTAAVKWNFEFNYARSTLSNIIITDTVGKDSEGNPNQLIKEDSFKVYKVNLSGESDKKDGGTATKETDEFTDYDLDVDVANGTFELKLPEGDDAYYIEYETIFLGESGDTLANEVQVAYESANGTEAKDEFSAANFTFGGGGTSTKVPFIVEKIDGTTGELLDGAEFELYRDGIDNPILTGKTEDGILDFGVLLGEAKYKLKETAAPAGYDKDLAEDLSFTLDRNSLAESGLHEGKQVVQFKNYPEGYDSSQACTQFTITIKDVDGNSITSGEVTLTDSNGKETQHSTWTDGKLRLPDEFTAGEYSVKHETAGDLGKVVVKYDDNCEDEVQPAPTCDLFEVLVKGEKDSDGAETIRANTEFTVKFEDSSVDDFTVETDEQGKFTLPSESTKTGQYTIYEGKQLIGSFTVTYKGDCEATVESAPTCPTFTLTVKDVDGEFIEKDTEVGIKIKDSNDSPITKTVGDDGKVTLDDLEANVYEVYIDDQLIGEFSSNTDCEAEVQPKPTCDYFTITLKVDNEPREGEELTIKDGDDVVSTNTTGENGSFTVPSKDLPAGTYDVYKGEKKIGTVQVSYQNDPCEAEVTLSQSDQICPNDIITVNKSNGKPDADVEVTIVDEDDNKITATTDEDGKVTTTEPLEHGKTYKVFKGKKELGEFTKDLFECEYEVQPKSSGGGWTPPEPEVCEAFTVTVKEDGKPVESGTYTFTSEDGETEVSGSVDKDGKIVFDRDELPAGSYKVTNEDGEEVGTITVEYGEEDCGATVNIVPSPEVCEAFTVTVKEDGQPVESGTYTFTSDDATVSGSVDKDGKIVFDRDELPAGSYTVTNEDGEEVGTITVSYEDDNCSDEINIVTPEVCEQFTVTILEDGERPTSGTYKFTSKDGETVKEKSVDSNGTIIFNPEEFPEGAYTVENEDGITSSITVDYSEDCEGTVSFSSEEEPEDEEDPEGEEDPEEDPNDTEKPGTEDPKDPEDDNSTKDNEVNKDDESDDNSAKDNKVDKGSDDGVKGGTVGKGDSGKGGHVSGGKAGVGSGEAAQDGKGGWTLPKTATNLFNIALAGITLLVIGAVIVYRRRKAA